MKYVQFKGFYFTQTRMVSMEPYEPVGRGDWAIHRGGAIFMKGTENCLITDCNFEYVGGTAVFMSGYNQKSGVTNCRFYHTGESAVCFVGDTTAAKNYLTWDDVDINKLKWNDKWKNKDMSPGPATLEYPDKCFMRNCIAYELGDYGKQVAGAFISMSREITVSHCTIYDVPRAAVCINDGSWGGHIIENCDIWNTVRETGEHGPFNSWGRDRIWPYSDRTDPSLVAIDMVSPNIIRHNRINNSRGSISAGNWAIDLDDGSSRYEIYNNLCLGSTLKLRDGYYRKVWNNIFVSAVPIGLHVWPDNSGDEFYNNISVISGAVEGGEILTDVFIKPIGMPVNTKWGKEIDYNLYYNLNDKNAQMCPGVSILAWQQKGYDKHSLFADPLFSDPKQGDYTLKPGSPAFKLGFKNFPMDQFGNLMTRIEPFGGEFKDSILVTIYPDNRGGKIYYTLDGSKPSLRSFFYGSSFYLNNSTTVRAQTFKNGVAIGFESEVVFSRVSKVNTPSWYRALTDGRFLMEIQDEITKRPEKKVLNWKGATLTDISKGDMVDAMGGFDFGVVLEKVPLSSVAYHIGFRPWDICVQWNGKKVKDIEEFNVIANSKKGKTGEITVMRGYEKIMIKL